MRKIDSIAECVVEARAKWNLLVLLRAAYLIVLQRRVIEVVYCVFCRFRLSPSEVNVSAGSAAVESFKHNLKKSLFAEKTILSRRDLVHIFFDDYAVHFLPVDFSGARLEGVTLCGNLLVIGEYGFPGKRVAIVSKTSCSIDVHYNDDLEVRHIHSICNTGIAGRIYISTGDAAKYLDLWDLAEDSLAFVKRVNRLVTGYTAMIKIGHEYFFGTDFSGRPNYLVIRGDDRKKIPFPKKAYKMYVIRLLVCEKRYLACLSQELKCLGGKSALSIFDIARRQFIYCDYVNYVEPGTACKVIHRAAILMRSNTAGGPTG